MNYTNNVYMNINMKTLTVFFLIFIGTFSINAQIIFIETESFENRGGWVIDQQSMDQMGSPYLMAHGLGIPVENATMRIDLPKKAIYRIWVRTRNWVAPWDVPETPGRFQLLFNKNLLETTFGTEGAEWHWQNGGTIQLNKGEVEIEIHDLTGFNGRCDAIILTKDLNFTPPNELNALAQFRQSHLNLPAETRYCRHLRFSGCRWRNGRNHSSSKCCQARLQSGSNSKQTSARWQ
jgi:hypothetical protein